MYRSVSCEKACGTALGLLDWVVKGSSRRCWSSPVLLETVRLLCSYIRVYSKDLEYRAESFGSNCTPKSYLLHRTDVRHWTLGVRRADLPFTDTSPIEVGSVSNGSPPLVRDVVSEPDYQIARDVNARVRGVVATNA